MALLSVIVDPADIPEHSVELNILSPVSGNVCSLEEVDNLLYCQSLFGDGVAIQVAGYRLVAPFDATVIDCPPTAHRIRIRDKNGIKLQIQCGDGAQLLYGEGFKAHVKTGQKISQGAPILDFDLRKLKQSLANPLFIVTVLNSNKLKAMTVKKGKVTALEDSLLNLFI